jgi:hypothetical protein
MPILRHGILSMLPDAPIQVDSGFEEVYLTEVRSIGGISGSPVYVRRTIHLSTTDDGDEVSGLGTRFYLLGLMRTHWDINAGKLNQQRLEVTRDGVNMGIGVVVPSAKIIEVINHPDFVVARQEAEERLRDSIRTTSD